MNLRQQLGQVLRGRVCVMGLGNVEYGDDGSGIHLAASLIGAGIPHVISVGNTPERHLRRVADAKYDRVLFVDAVDVGAEPGSAVLLSVAEISTRFPQVSTHKISLGLLARWAEENGVGEVWLLGVQPGSTRPGDRLSQPVQTTLGAFARCWRASLRDRHTLLSASAAR
ncbi:MAG TPA: hydrogenase maturation protease [Terriglobales bacterium]|nr:hydrogenase maturation protease [Terriglobales bacterium]